MFTQFILGAFVTLVVVVALIACIFYFQERPRGLLRFFENLLRALFEDPEEPREGTLPTWLGSQWILWIIALTPVCTGFLAFFLLENLWYALVGIFLSTLVVYLSLNEIPANPPHVGVPTFWGRRLERLEKEGVKLFPDFFPVFYSFIPILIEKRNEDFNFNIRCRLEEDAEEEDIPGISVFNRIMGLIRRNEARNPQSGGVIKVKIGVTWEPDYESGQKKPRRLHNFINAGRDEGVKDIIKEVIIEDFRQLGRKLPWVYMNFATDILGMLLVYALTGTRVPKLQLDDVGRPASDDHGNQLFERDESGKIIENHPFDATEEDCNYYLKAVLTNGLSDIRDLGIKIRRINIAEIEAIGRLADDAEQAARERQQRAMQREQLATRREGVRFVRDEMGIGDELSDSELWEFLLVEEKIIPRTIRDIRVTSQNPGELIDAAAVNSTREEDS